MYYIIYNYFICSDILSWQICLCTCTCKFVYTEYAFIYILPINHLVLGRQINYTKPVNVINITYNESYKVGQFFFLLSPSEKCLIICFLYKLFRLFLIINESSVMFVPKHLWCIFLSKIKYSFWEKRHLHVCL